jgi:hypothetical protein
VADQQLNSRLGVIEPSRVRPQRHRKVFDAVEVGASFDNLNHDHLLGMLGTPARE